MEGKRMGYVTENTIDKRLARVKAAINLKEGDRVPFAPKVSNVYAQAGGISLYELYHDYRNMKQGVINFLKRYEPDLYWQTAAYPGNVLEVLGTTSVKWPGATCGIPRDKGHQIVNEEVMLQEEYDEFLRNPSEFFMQKVFPRKNSKIAGLSKISFSNVIEFGHFASMAAFADPEVRAALLTLMFAGEESAKWLAACGELAEVALDMQTPLCCIVGQPTPYDMLADNLRGFVDLPMDVIEVPDKVLAAIDVMTDFALKGVHAIKAQGMQYVFMPLHGGTDDFMSNDTYGKFYWPSLKRVIEEIVKLDMTPYIFLEGKYSSRYEIIRDVPPGKCIYMFEQVDIAEAKRKLADVVCVAGNLPSSLLIYGDKRQVIDETKRMLDACAPGGGFIMDCSIVLDHYNEENMDAWLQTTLDYGKY
jgi:uroporphyrinogen-III decarboxylase